MILRFNKFIYSRPAIEKAKKAYEKLASFSLKENKDYFILELKGLVENEELIEKEFKNYVLGEVSANEKK